MKDSTTNYCIKQGVMIRRFNFSFGDIEVHAEQKQGKRWFRASVLGQCAFGYSSSTDLDWKEELRLFCSRVLMFRCEGKQQLLKRLKTL